MYHFIVSFLHSEVFELPVLIHGDPSHCFLLLWGILSYDRTPVHVASVLLMDRTSLLSFPPPSRPYSERCMSLCAQVPDFRGEGSLAGS